MTEAACRGKAPDTSKGEQDIFFPERGQSALGNQAKLVCASCPVFRECRKYQRRFQSPYGIWAGKQETPG